jgi:uncharacterized protein
MSKLYVVKGRYKAELELVCDKCGDKYPLKLDEDFEIFLTKKNETEEDGQTIIEIGNADQVNLVPYIREEIVLNLPFTSLCSDNCKGLCPVCGKNLNREQCDCEDESGNNIFGDIDLDKLGLK